MSWKIFGSQGINPCARAFCSFNLIGNKVFIYGGYYNYGRLGDLHSFDLESWTWSQPSCTGPSPGLRRGHASCSDGKYIYIHGGCNEGVRLSDMFVLDTENMEWKEINYVGDVPEPRSCHCMVKFDNHIYLFGGCNGIDYYGDIFILDLSSCRWERIKTMNAPTNRHQHCGGIWNGKIVIYGGHGSGFFKDVWIFDPRTKSWDQIQTKGVPPKASQGSTIAIEGDKMYAFGGIDGSGKLSSEFKVLDLKQFTWKNTDTDGPKPSARDLHNSCIWKSNFLVFGGYDGALTPSDIYSIDITSLKEIEENSSDFAAQKLDHSSSNRQSGLFSTLLSGKVPASIDIKKPAQKTKIQRKPKKAYTPSKAKALPRKKDVEKKIRKHSPATVQAPNFCIYINKVLTKMHPDLGITEKALETVNTMLNDIFNAITDEASAFMKENGRKTLTSTDLQKAVKLSMPGELGRHAVFEGAKSICNYINSNL